MICGTKIHLTFSELLWTAPEHLCLTPGGVIGSSQKGDVYSFAIILQEIAMRAGPYEGNSQDVDGMATDFVISCHVILINLSLNLVVFKLYFDVLSLTKSFTNYPNSVKSPKQENQL